VSVRVPQGESGRASGRQPRQLPSAGGVGRVAAKLSERYAIVALWGLMVAVYSVLEPSTFDTSGTFQTIFGSQAALVFLSMAFLTTVVVGEFVDLSVASVLGLCATIVPVLSVLDHVNVVLASAIAVAVGLCAGAVNGLLVVYVGVNTIVVTLGMSTLLSGIALAIAHLSAVSGLSASFGQLALANVGGLPVSFYYGLAIALAFAYVLAFTPLGRHMQFVGANREVSRLAGVRVDPSTSITYLLPTVSAVFLGTAAVRPGRFNPLGTLIALYFLATGILGLEELGLAGWISDVFYGAALVVAVTLTTLLRKRAPT
jgi:ribose transport system permease protein